MAATEASIITPVQSPAAYTPGVWVLETRSTGMNPLPLSAIPASSRPSPPVLGTIPTVSRQCEPRIVRPSSRTTTTPSPLRFAVTARDRPSTVMPRRRNTSSTTAAASASSCGSTRSREDTSVTCEPRAW